jgi:hypothetical protein
MRYEGKKEPSWSWRKVIVGAIIIGLVILLAGPIAAHASTRVRWGVDAVQDYHYSVTEYRSGLVFDRDLWRAQQQVHWSWNQVCKCVFKGPSVLRSGWVSDTWNDYRLDKKWTHELRDPHRWQFYAKWTFISNGSELLVDHDHPEIWQTVFANNPQRVTYTAHCGC